MSPNPLPASKLSVLIQTMFVLQIPVFAAVIFVALEHKQNTAELYTVKDSRRLTAVLLYCR